MARPADGCDPALTHPLAHQSPLDGSLSGGDFFGAMPFKPFTSETAREMSLRSAEARRRRRDEALRALTEAPPNSPDAEYVAQQLVVARAHLAKLDKAIAVTNDPLALDRLLRAVSAAAERERILAGRPLPGKALVAKPEAKPARIVEPL